MSAPIPVEKAEGFILEYMRLRYLWSHGDLPKLNYYVRQKAEEFGFCLRTGLYLVAYAKDVGMIN